MLRKEMFLNQNHKLKHKQTSQKNKVIFLDIDGVLQPLGRQCRFDHDMEATREYLAKAHSNACFLEIDKYDLAAAYYDWNFIAIGILRELVEEDHCRIVIHSGWREYLTFEKLKALFQIYGLEESIIGVTDKGDKTESINKYLSEHDEIDSYVVIDDDKTLLYDFGSKFCFTHNFMTTDDYDQCKTILQYEFHIEQKDSMINCYINNEVYQCFSLQQVETKNLNVWILSLVEYERILEFRFLQCIINELIKHLAINRPDLSGMILLESDWKCKGGVLDRLGIYKESAHVFYLPTQRESTFFSLNINASWGEIKKALT